MALGGRSTSDIVTQRPLTSPVGDFLDTILKRAEAVGLLKQQAALGVATDVAKQKALLPGEIQKTIETEKAKAEFDPSAQFFRQIMGGGVPTTGGTPISGDVFSRISQVQQQLPAGLKLKLGEVGTLERPIQPQEKVQALESAKTTLRSIDELEKLVIPAQGGDPSALLTKGFPGVPGARNLAGIFQNLVTEIVTSRGGKQLTPTEIQLITRNLPSRLDAVDFMITKDPSNVQNRLDRLKVISQGLIAGLDPDAISAQSAQIQQQQAVGGISTGSALSNQPTGAFSPGLKIIRKIQ